MTVLMMEERYTHQPVLLKEAVSGLVTDAGGTYLDATLGLGGHSLAILQSLNEAGRLIGTDMDPEALGIAAERLSAFSDRIRLVRANFRNLDSVLGDSAISGALFDLGVSSLQFDKPERGFSIQHEGPLDMRLDPNSPLTADRIVNEWPAEQIELLLREYGEERAAGRIARSIVAARKTFPFTSTFQLASFIERMLPKTGRIHPATKTFMALRIAVNQELENLTRGLEAAAARIAPRGRIAVISFHSLEDRIVKNLFKAMAESGLWRHVTNSPVSPEAEEEVRNPRSRSSKLRIIERTS